MTLSVESVGETKCCYACLMTFWPFFFLPAIHPLIHPALFPGFLSVRKLQCRLSTDTLSRPVCHLQARETIGSNLVSLSCCLVSGFPVPTSSFISDLQRKTWETLSHAHTNMRAHLPSKHKRTPLIVHRPSRHDRTAHTHSCVLSGRCKCAQV